MQSLDLKLTKTNISNTWTDKGDLEPQKNHLRSATNLIVKTLCWHPRTLKTECHATLLTLRTITLSEEKN